MDHHRRWQAEQQFFDDEEYNDLPIPSSVIERYTLCRKPWLAAEFPFSVLGDVREKYILELGCGDGGNAILLALRGAQVAGVDISPKAIEVARHRAGLHGVSQDTTFTAGPLEAYRPPDDRRFDIVCGWAVLHHLIPVFDSVLETLAGFAAPGALFLFAEPICTWPWLRRARLLLPISARGTQDERPLESAEIAVLRKYVPALRVRYFNASVRVLNRFILRGLYEDLSPLARAAYDAIARADAFCLNHLGLAGFASAGVVYGAVRQQPVSGWPK